MDWSGHWVIPKDNDHVAGNLRVDDTGIDRVHPNAVLDIFEGGRAG
jgi:hypothetical protein